MLAAFIAAVLVFAGAFFGGGHMECVPANAAAPATAACPPLPIDALVAPAVALVEHVGHSGDGR